MSVKEKILGYFKRIFNINKSRETTPIKITEITKLGSDLDDYVNKILNILPKIEQTRTSILSEFGERLEGMDKNLAVMSEKVEKMSNFPEISDDELEMINQIEKVKAEIRAGDIDKDSIGNYMLGLRIAKLVSKDEELIFKPDEGTKRRLEELKEDIKPELLEEKFEEFRNETSTRINELERRALPDLDKRLLKDLEIIRSHYIGLAWYKKGEYEKALKIFSEACMNDSKMSESLLNKGAALGKLGRHEEEIDCYNKALQKREKYPDAMLINKCIALLESDKDKEAKDLFDEAREIISKKMNIRRLL